MKVSPNSSSKKLRLARSAGALHFLHSPGNQSLSGNLILMACSEAEGLEARSAAIGRAIPQLQEGAARHGLHV